MKSHFNYVNHKTLEEWHEWRDQKIGASDISFIMGSSPYKSRSKLLVEKKTGIKEKGPDFIFQKGHRFEAHMRPVVEMLLDYNFPAICVVPCGTPFDDFLSASLDGFDEKKNVIWECKLVGKDVFHEMKESQKPPEKYKYQVQQQLLITKAKMCILTFGTDESNYDYITVYPDSKLQNELVEAAKVFWDEWKSDEKPPEGFVQTMQEFYDLNEMAKQAKKKADAAKKRLEKYDYSKTFEEGGFVYTKTVSLVDTFKKDIALKFIPEDKQKECFEQGKRVTYAVKKLKANK